MKRITLSVLALLLISLSILPMLSSCTSERGNGGTTTLYVYNWGEYISDGSEGTEDVNEQFERWYFDTYGEKVKVNYSTYSSNESMYAKIESGSSNYDIIIPSDYMIQRLIAEDLLHPLRYENIPNVKDILPDFQNAAYDPDLNSDGYNDYSVPYLYGMIGIIYNVTMVDPADIGDWDLMWNDKYAGNILQFNNSRDAFGTAQYFLTSDVNSDNEQDWRDALDKLKEQKPLLQGYVMDEIFNKMENGSAAIAAYYAGDYLAMYENNPDLEFYYPKKGTNLYVDAMCIPKSSKNQLIAERYINFMLSVDEEYGAPAIANAEYTYYASPNAAVRNDPLYKAYMNSIKTGGYDTMYGTDGIFTSSYENLDEDKLILLNNLWEELKSDVNVSGGIYALAIGIVVLLAALFLWRWIVKRSRMQY